MPCREWQAGAWHVNPDGRTRELFAAVVERAVLDERAKGFAPRDLVCLCGGNTQECAAVYLERLRRFVEDEDGDPVAGLLMVAKLAT